MMRIYYTGYTIFNQPGDTQETVAFGRHLCYNKQEREFFMKIELSDHSVIDVAVSKKRHEKYAASRVQGRQRVR